MKYLVSVSHTWRGQTTFEFEEKEAAETFQAAVQSGDLNAVIEQGDIDSGNVELLDFDAGRVNEVDRSW